MCSCLLHPENAVFIQSATASDLESFQFLFYGDPCALGEGVWCICLFVAVHSAVVIPGRRDVMEMSVRGCVCRFLWQ